MAISLWRGTGENTAAQPDSAGPPGRLSPGAPLRTPSFRRPRYGVAFRVPCRRVHAAPSQATLAGCGEVPRQGTLAAEYTHAPPGCQTLLADVVPKIGGRGRACGGRGARLNRARAQRTRRGRARRDAGVAESVPPRRGRDPAPPGAAAGADPRHSRGRYVRRRRDAGPPTAGAPAPPTRRPCWGWGRRAGRRWDHLTSRRCAIRRSRRGRAPVPPPRRAPDQETARGARGGIAPAGGGAG